MFVCVELVYVSIKPFSESDSPPNHPHLDDLSIETYGDLGYPWLPHGYRQPPFMSPAETSPSDSHHRTHQAPDLRRWFGAWGGMGNPIDGSRHRRFWSQTATQTATQSTWRHLRFLAGLQRFDCLSFRKQNMKFWGIIHIDMHDAHCWLCIYWVIEDME